MKVSVSAHDPPESAGGAENIYDLAGRIEETRRWADVEIQMADITDAEGYLVGRKSTGWLHAYSEPNSYTRTEYDFAGRVKSTFVLDEAGYEQPTSFEYDFAGKQIAVIDALGHDITYNDDDPCYSGPRPGGIASFSLNGTGRTETEYEGGRRKLVRDALSNETEFIYDAVGRVIQTTYPSADLDHDGNADDPSYTYTRYDKHGRKALQSAQTRQTDPNHIDDAATETNDWMLRKREYLYNTAGSLRQVKLAAVDDPEDSPDAGETVHTVYEYFYDIYGNQVGILDSKNRLTVFKYNEIHKQTARYMPFEVTPGSVTNAEEVYTALDSQSPQPAVELRQYDTLGRIESVIDYEGKAQEFVYDSLGRLSFKYLYDEGSAEPDKIIEYVYDSLGRKIQVIFDDIVEQDIYYDTEGRVIKIITPKESIGYDYSDITGRRTSVYTPANSPDTKIDYAYDPLGRLDTVTTDLRNGLNVNEVTTYGYTDVGSVDWVCLPNGGCADYTYDNLNRLTLLENKDPCDVVLSSFEYELSADGMRVSVTESDSLGDTVEIFWDYDSLNRLLQEVYDDQIGTKDYTHDYIYDLASNRLSLTKDSVVTYYEYDEKDQLLTESPNSDYSDPNIEYGYDDNGTLVLKTDYVNDVVYEYTYNLDNRLSSFILKEQPIGTPNGTVLASYAYDPDGNRIQKSASGVTTDYLIDPYNHTGYSQTLKETTGSSERTFIIGSDVLAQADDSAQPVYLLYDGHGSVRQISDSDSGVINDFGFDAYGNLLYYTTAPQTALLYTGEYYDSVLKMQYLRSRWTNPSTGRFNRQDEYPGSGYDPHSLHKYLYCSNNPVNNIDPTGQFSLTELNYTGMMRATLMAMNIYGGVYHARGVATSFTSVINAWSSGDFWGGLPHVVMGSLHGVGLVASAAGINAGLQGPPPGSVPALATVGGGAMRAGGFWVTVTSNPALAGWVIEQVAPAAYTGYMMVFAAKAGDGENAQNHHKVPHSNKQYRHEDHPLMKQAGWDNDSLINNPSNQMKLYNHRGRHWGQYHQAIKKMMDDAHGRVCNQGREAARNALQKIFEEIEVEIKSGELKPYEREVW